MRDFFPICAISRPADGGLRMAKVTRDYLGNCAVNMFSTLRAMMCRSDPYGVIHQAHGAFVLTKHPMEKIQIIKGTVEDAIPQYGTRTVTLLCLIRLGVCTLARFTDALAPVAARTT